MTGIGVDIVDIRRIEQILKKDGARFLKKFFSDEEIQLSKKYKGKKYAPFFAKRFAGKEAVAKAFGTGLGSKLSFKDISIEKLATGQPVVRLSKNATAYFEKKYERKITIQISLSDDHKLNAAIAFVLINY